MGYQRGQVAPNWDFIGRRMTRLSHLTLRNFLIALHDLLATTAALFAAFYLRFEGGDGFFDRLPLLFQILPYFLAFSVVVFFVFNLTTTKWRFISLPDALNIIRVATVLTVALLVLDYIFVAPNVRGAFFLGKVTIVLYWFLEIAFLSALRMAYRYFRYTRVRRHAEDRGCRADAADRPRRGCRGAAARHRERRDQAHLAGRRAVAVEFRSRPVHPQRAGAGRHRRHRGRRRRLRQARQADRTPGDDAVRVRAGGSSGIDPDARRASWA